MLENEIEILRAKLDTTVTKYGLNDKETIYISRQLDKLINQFNKNYQLKSKN